MEKLCLLPNFLVYRGEITEGFGNLLNVKFFRKKADSPENITPAFH